VGRVRVDADKIIRDIAPVWHKWVGVNVKYLAAEYLSRGWRIFVKKLDGSNQVIEVVPETDELMRQVAIYGPWTANHHGYYVAREWRIANGETTPGPLVVLAPNLNRARRLVHLALPQLNECMGRSPEDDPNIMETWI
jgi:hypothetical protein